MIYLDTTVGMFHGRSLRAAVRQGFGWRARIYLYPTRAGKMAGYVYRPGSPDLGNRIVADVRHVWTDEPA
jgi:hypothetical protein